MDYGNPQVSVQNQLVNGLKNKIEDTNYGTICVTYLNEEDSTKMFVSLSSPLQINVSRDVIIKDLQVKSDKVSISGAHQLTLKDVYIADSASCLEVMGGQVIVDNSSETPRYKSGFESCSSVAVNFNYGANHQLNSRNISCGNGGIGVRINSANVTIEQSVISSCLTGVEIVGGANALVKDSTIECHESAGKGIDIQAMNTKVQNVEVSNCDLGIHLASVNAIIGAESKEDEELGNMNRIHDNHKGILVESQLTNMFAYNLIYKNKAQGEDNGTTMDGLSVVDPQYEVSILSSVEDEESEDGEQEEQEQENALFCDVSEEGVIQKAYLKLGGINFIENEDKLVIYEMEDKDNQVNELVEEPIAECFITDSNECDLTNSSLEFMYSSETKTCKYSENYMIGVLYRKSQDVYGFTTSFTDKFRLVGDIVAMVGTYDGPTQVSGEDDLPEEGGITTLGGGEDLGGSSSDGETIEESGGFIVRVDDTEFSDDDGSTNSSGGAGGGGEASGMGPKMCSLNPNAGNTYAPWILGWWILTTVVIVGRKRLSFLRRQESIK